MKICDESLCMGCCTCMNICPQSCIRMTENMYGEIHPVIDDSICVRCNMCVKYCPINKINKKERAALEAYAGYRKDFDGNQGYTSGGIATLIAENFLRDGGVFYGAVFDDNLNLVFKKISSSNDLKSTIGSKYTQIYSGETFTEIRDLLNCGEKVLFIATPCQVDGLKSFLNKEYDNLITCDLVCHGVSPNKYLKDHVSYLCHKHKINKKISDVKFRGTNDFKLKLLAQNNEVFVNRGILDSYFQGFLKGITLRQSCYTCKYANMNRTGDITLGDYLSNREGLEYPLVNGMPKLSLILINTDKGKKYFDEISKFIILKQKKVEDATEGMISLKQPFPTSKYRKEFLEKYINNSFEKAMKNIMIKIFILDFVIGEKVFKLFRKKKKS